VNRVARVTEQGQLDKMTACLRNAFGIGVDLGKFQGNPFMNEPTGQKTRGDSPQAAAREFRSLLGASEGVPGQSGTDPDILEQLGGLEAWAEARGELAGGGWLTEAQCGGAEHFIQHAAGDERLVKVTYPGEYGLRMRLVLPAGTMPDRLSDAIGLGPATPLQYLDRLALHNDLFGDDVEFLGLVRQRGRLSMVISQIFLRGEKPEIPQIESFMADNGFRKAGGENVYFRTEDRLAVFDAHARNFVLTEGVPVPFDVIPQYVSGRMEALLALWARK